MKLWIKWLALGILSVLFGLYVLAHPVAASVAVTIVAGIMFMFLGAAQVYTGFTSEGVMSKIMGVALGVLLALLGISLTFQPLAGMMSLATVVTILIGANGVVRLATSFQMRNTPYFWPMLFSGVLSILLAGYVVANFFEIAPQLLGILMGIEMIFNGAGLVALGIFVRKAGDKIEDVLGAAGKD